jgi:ACS family tartrate transporter-like MFS transporter
MMLIEGAPAIIGGVLAFFLLIDRPDQAPWLSPKEKDWLNAEIARDQSAVKGARHLSTWKTLTDPKVLYLSLVFFLYQCGSFGIGYWLPQLIKGFSKTLTNLEVGLIAMAPYALATVGMVLWSIHSDRKRERQAHSALPLLISGLALCAVSVLSNNQGLSLALFSVALSGFYAFKAPFWGLPALFLSRSTAAISIAVINSVGNLGGFVGPYLFGSLKDRVGVSGGMLLLSVLVLLASALTMLIRLRPTEATGLTAAVAAAEAD